MRADTYRRPSDTGTAAEAIELHKRRRLRVACRVGIVCLLGGEQLEQIDLHGVRPLSGLRLRDLRYCDRCKNAGDDNRDEQGNWCEACALRRGMRHWRIHSGGGQSL